MADHQLEIPAKQQNLEQTRTIQVCERFVAETDEQGAVRTFFEQPTDGLDLGSVERPASNQGLEHVQPLIASEKEVIEAELSRRQGNHRRFCATARLAAFLVFQDVHDLLTRLPLRITCESDF